MNVKLSNFIFRFMPAALFVAYGVTMVLLVVQYRTVGIYATLFRAVAWQAVLLLALADRSHLEAKEKVQELERQIDQALRTTGIRRVEFDALKKDLDRIRDLLVETHKLQSKRD